MSPSNSIKSGFSYTTLSMNDYKAPVNVVFPLATDFPEAAPLITPPNFTRNHQTLLVLEMPLTSSENYIERTHRIATSFNHNQTAKADVVLLVGNHIIPYYSEIYIPEYISQIKKPTAAVIKAVNKWAMKFKYTIVLFAVVPGREFD